MQTARFNVLIIVFISMMFNTSCLRSPQYLSPAGYDLEHPVKVFLPDELSEISGIVYYPKDTSVFAISDATGSLYKIFPDRNVLVQKWKFGSNHDYEDLQRIDSTFYILASNGDLVGADFSSKDSIHVTDYTINDSVKNEFETLYYDSMLKKLILICKNCSGDKKTTVSTRAFDIATKTYTDGPYKIHIKQYDNENNAIKVKFKPSAAAINPLTHELFILASVNNELVIADRKGNIKEAYKLRPSLYNQPEGIAFTPKGDLLISNESGGKHGTANILVIKHKK